MKSNKIIKIQFKGFFLRCGFWMWEWFKTPCTYIGINDLKGKFEYASKYMLTYLRSIIKRVMSNKKLCTHILIFFKPFLLEMIKFKKKYLFCNLTTNYLIVPYLLIFQNPINIDYTVLLLRKSIIINHSLMMENIPIQKEPFFIIKSSSLAMFKSYFLI